MYGMFLWFDAPLLQTFGSVFGESRMAAELLFLVSGLSLAKAVPFAAFYWWAWFSPAPRKAGGTDAARRFVVRNLIAVTLALGLGRGLQLLLPFRPRPYFATDYFYPTRLSPDVLGTLNSWSSFPSDHALFLGAMATGVWFWSRCAGVIAALWVCLAVLLPRIILGLHYPSDMIVGAGLGVALMCLMLRLPLPQAILDLPLRLAHTRPSLAYMLAFLGTYELSVNFVDVRSLARAVFDLIAGPAPNS